MAPPTRKKRYHHGALRKALVNEARRLVREEGAAGVSMRAIGRAVGVSHAALYHHFPDREALLAAVAAEGFAGLWEAMLERARSCDGPPLTRLQEAGVAYVVYACADPHRYRLMFGDHITDRARFPELQQSADAAYAVLGRLLGEMAHSPAEGLADHPASRAAWAMVHGVAMLLIDGRFGADVSPGRAEEITREVTTVMGLGLRSMT